MRTARQGFSAWSQSITNANVMDKSRAKALLARELADACDDVDVASMCRELG